MSPYFFHPISTYFSLPKSEFLSPCHPQGFLPLACPTSQVSCCTVWGQLTLMFPWENLSQHCLRWCKPHGRRKPARGHLVLPSLWFLNTHNVSSEAGLPYISSTEYSKYVFSSLIPMASWEPPSAWWEEISESHDKEQHPLDRCYFVIAVRVRKWGQPKKPCSCT